jgi:hypothetical protein
MDPPGPMLMILFEVEKTTKASRTDDDDFILSPKDCNT